MQEQIS